MIPYGLTVLIGIIAGGLVVWAQVDDDTRREIDKLFPSPSPNDQFSRLEEVTRSTTGSFGALQKCGEGSDERVHTCVPYYQCDGVTGKVIQDRSGTGIKVISIRFGENSCPESLDYCCLLPTPGDREPVVPTPSSTTTTSRRPIVQGCGVRNPNGFDFKISGAHDNEAEYGEFPWMLAVLNANFDSTQGGNLALCGASLLTPNVVLTAAHCVANVKVQDIKIRAGEWDTQTEKERLPYQERFVSQIIVHENFEPKVVYNDVALLILQQPFELDQHIGTICLPRHNEIISSRNCFASGWGKDIFGKEGKRQVILKKIELPMVPWERCQDALRTTRLGQHFSLHKSFICAGGEAGKDACTGDGGSPLVCPDANNPGRYVQAGIVAWGIGCGEENIPGVYADVAKFRDWIDEKLQRLNINTRPYNL